MPDSEFRWLSDLEFEQLSPEQKYAYIKKVVDHIRANPQAESPDSKNPETRRE